MARRSIVSRLVARLFIRGAEAPFVLQDLEDSFNADVSRGVPVAEARRRDLANVIASAGSMWAGTLRLSAWRPSWVDVKLGFRTIGRNPGLSVVAIFALAIGIPVGLAPMQAVDALEQSLPGDSGGRIRTLCYWRDTTHEDATTGDYAFWKTSLRSFTTLAAYRQTVVDVDTGGSHVSVPAIATTASAFGVLHVSAARGRVLRVEDERPGAPDVAVIGDDLWRAQFGADPEIVGRHIRMSGTSVAVVGVMPPGFRFPTSQQLWMPLRLIDDGAGPHAGAPVVVFGALAAGATTESASAELQALSAASAATNGSRAALSSGAPGADLLRAAVLPAWHLTFDFPSPGGLRALPEFSLVQLLMLAPLVIACVNVGLLVLAQTSTRASEFAMRTALGASRARIVTQVFVEFLVLALLAAGAGLVVLEWLSGRLLAGLGIALPYWIDTGLSAATVARGLLLAVGSAALAGVVPALRMTRPSIDATIKRARAGTSGRRPGGLSSALIVIDVAVAVIAIGIAGGLWGKVQATRPSPSVDGVDARSILAVTLDVRSAPPRDAARVQTRLIETLRAEPGVRAVTFASALPRMDHPVRLMEIDRDGAGGLASAPDRFKVRVARVATDFFDALGQPMVAGRAFDSRDLQPDARTIIVNTTFAERAFGSVNVVGRRVREVASDGESRGGWREVVGVVGHLGLHALTPSQDDGVYLPMAAGDINPVRLAVTADGDRETLARRMPELARAIDPDAVVAAAVPLDALFEGDWYFLRALVAAVAVLVAVLLSLAASALYAILSLAVSQRTREIGIRVALGADRRRIARDVAARAVAQIAMGVLLGLPVAGALCYEFLAMTTSGGSVPGAVAMASALGACVLLFVSVCACTVPTLRALKIAPADALRRTG